MTDPFDPVPDQPTGGSDNAPAPVQDAQQPVGSDVAPQQQPSPPVLSHESDADVAAFAAEAQKASEQDTIDESSFKNDVSEYMQTPEAITKNAAEQAPIQQQKEVDDYVSTMNPIDRDAFQSILKSSPDNAKAMMNVDKAVSQAGSLARTVFDAIGNLGNALDGHVADTVKAIIAPPTAADELHDEVISDDYKSFKNSQDYKDGLQNLETLASDIVSPYAKAFIQSSYIDQLGTTMKSFEPEVDERGVSTENPIEAIMRGMTMIPAGFMAISGGGAATQTIAEGMGFSKQDAIDIGQGTWQILAAAEGVPTEQVPHVTITRQPMWETASKDIPEPDLVTKLKETSANGTEDQFFNEPIVYDANKTPIAPDQEVSPVRVNQPQTIHDIVRQNNPEVFSKWDAISSKLERLHGWISDLAQKRDDNIMSDPDVVEAKGKVDDLTDTNNQKIKTILDKVNGVEDRLTKNKAATVADLRSQISDANDALNDLVEGKKTEDTPDMTMVRNQIGDLAREKSGLADDVNKAYQDAQQQMPETKTVPEPTFNVAKENPEPYLGEVIGEKEPEQPSQQDTMRNNVIGDIVQKLTAAGRSTEEATAQAHVVSSFFQTMSDLYGGAKGTIEDWYRNEGANVVKQGERTKQLAQKGALEQKAKGSYIPSYISNTGSAIIRLMKRADASTFIHESAHHFLDIMVKYASEEGAPKQLVDDVAKIREWLGKSKGNFSGFTRLQHESFARAFERYFLEGHAPTEGMADVFAKIKKMFTDIYKSVANIPDQKVQINDDVRQVFDRMLGKKSETIISSKEETGKEFADLHVQDAKETAPKDAAAAMDNVKAEISKLAENNDKEAYDAIKSGEAETGAGNTVGTEQPSGEGTHTATPESSEVGAGNGGLGEQGGGLRATEPADADRNAAGGTGAGEPSGDSAERPADEPVESSKSAAGQTAYLDKDGRFRFDKFNTSDDAMAAMKEMAARNSDFLDARYGTAAYTQKKLIAANKQMVAQLSEQVALLINKERSPEDYLEYTRATQQLEIAMRLRAEFQSDWGHAGHELQKVVSTLNVPDPVALAKRITGKSLLQLDEEMKLMNTIDKPLAKAEFAADMRTGRYAAFEDATLAFFRNNILSNPLTHLAYLSSNYVKIYGRILVNTPFAALAGKIMRDKDRVSMKQIPYMLSVVHNATMNAYPVAVAAIKSGVPFMRGSVQGLVRVAFDEIFENKASDLTKDEKAFLRSVKNKNDYKGLTDEEIKDKKKAQKDAVQASLDAAKQEVKDKNVKVSDINENLVLENADKEAAAKQAAEYPAIHNYLAEAVESGTKAYKQSLPGKLGRALTLSERSIQGIHTLSYSTNYEMRVGEKAFQSAMKKGLDGDELNDYLTQYTQKPPLDVMQYAHEMALRDIYIKSSVPEVDRFLSILTSHSLPWTSARHWTCDAVCENRCQYD